MVDVDSMGRGLQFVGTLFLYFLLGKLSREFKLRRMSIFHEFQMPTFRYCVRPYSQMVGRAGTVCADVTLTRSKVKVTEHLSFKIAHNCTFSGVSPSAVLRGAQN